MVTIGSLFAGIGGLDLACEWGFGARTAWQLDIACEHIRRRHWPGVRQIAADVRSVDPGGLEPIDILAAGFPCQDLSCAGSGAGLDGSRSGLYSEVLRFAGALRPRWLVLENVPALLSRYRERVDGDLSALGYGVTWVRCRALDAGAPHIRRRVFVVAERGGCLWSRVVDVPRGELANPWPTPTAAAYNEGESHASFYARSAALVERGSRPISEPLGLAVRPWPTATAGDAKASGSRSLEGSGAHSGTSLTDAVRHDRARAGDCRPWATACATDHKDGARKGQLGDQLPGKLNPRWVECLMGYPIGWVEPSQPLFPLAPLHADRSPAWPAPRYPATWDRSEPWPQLPHEPPRTIPPGEYRCRAAQLRAVGNAVVPQQGALAIAAALSSS